MTNSNRNEKAIVLSIYGLVLSSIGILGPILPLYLTSLDIHPQELGLLFSCHMVAVAMGELIWGRVIDKVGMNVAMFTSTFIVAGFSSLFLIVESLPWLFILFFCLGFARAAIFISGRWYVAVNSPPSERASSMALVTAIFFGTRSISSILGGVLVDQWGYSPGLLSAVLGPLIGGILFVLTMNRLRSLKREESSSGLVDLDEIQPSIRQVIFGIVGIQGIVAALHYLSYSIFITYTPLLTTQILGADVTGAGALLSIHGFVNLITVIPLAKLADRRGKRRFIILGLLGSATAFLGMALAGNYLFLVLSAILFSFSFAIFAPSALALLSESVSNQYQGVAIGMYGFFEDAGMIAGSALGGFAWQQWGHMAAFLMGSIAAGIGALFGFKFLKQGIQKDVERSDALSNLE